MKRKWNPPFEPGPPHPCIFCDAKLETKFGRDLIKGWDWFCGYGDQVMHFCPSCMRTKRHDIEELRAAVAKKPDGYPHTMISVERILNPRMITKLQHKHKQ